MRNISIILVGTKYAGNIGSAARAMHNMGLDQLRLVSPQCACNEESYRLACGGKEILDQRRTYETLRDALQDIHLPLGTTAKTGGKRDQTRPSRLLAHTILAHAASQKVGILFGPEDTGLTDEDLMPCQLLMSIPASGGARSLNIAQAGMIVCYELLLAGLGKKPDRVPKRAAVPQVEAMYLQLEKALLDIGFLQPQNARHMMFSLRRLLGRAGLESADVGVLRGIARQIGWYSSRIAKSDLRSSEKDACAGRKG
jgi:tRNA/rRNA methyltransferase